MSDEINGWIDREDDADAELIDDHDALADCRLTVAAARAEIVRQHREIAALKEQLRVAVEALAGIDFGRVRDDGYCEACEECDSENPCIHRLAHDTLTRIASLSKPGDPTP